MPAPPAPLSSIPGLSQSNGIYREGPGFDLGAQGVGGELRNPQHFSLSVSSRRPPRRPRPTACSHAASRCRSRGANQHNIHLSISGSVPGRPTLCLRRLRAPGAVEHSFGGRGALFSSSIQDIIQKEGPVGLGGGATIATSGTGGRDSAELRAMGALPPSPTPTLL